MKKNNSQKMQEEYLDIIDSNGNLTGEKELRSVVHEKGLWHRTVHIYFYRIKNGSIEILVHLRAKFKNEKPNLWALHFGGHVESGQDLEEAIMHETEEEIGIRVEPHDLVKGIKGQFDSATNKEHYFSYYYNFEGDQEDLVFNDGEVQKVKWMAENEIVASIKNRSQKWTGKENHLKRFLEDLKSKI